MNLLHTNEFCARLWIVNQELVDWSFWNEGFDPMDLQRPVREWAEEYITSNTDVSSLLEALNINYDPEHPMNVQILLKARMRMWEFLDETDEDMEVLKVELVTIPGEYTLKS